MIVWGSRWRVRPRFFVFLALIIGLGASLFMASRSSRNHSPIALSSKKPAQSLIVRCHTIPSAFSLPQPLGNLQTLSVDNTLIAAGIISRHQPVQGLSVSITPQGLVQGPSPALLPGGSLILAQSMSWWSGGVKGKTVQRSALNLESNRSYTNFLPAPLSHSAITLSSSGTNLFLLGGASQKGVSHRIYEMRESSGSFHLWGSLPKAVESPAAASGKGFLVVAGGVLPQGGFNSDIWIYRLSSHHLLTTLHLPYGIAGSRIVYTQHHFWLLGGEKSPGHLLSSIWLITPSRLRKTPVHLPVPLAHFGAGVLNHKIWIVGGTTNHGPTAIIRTLVLNIATYSQRRHAK